MQKTLAIALCDTNYADRKQMERLLERESAKRQDSCVFYMDTYGNKEALLANKRTYDAYFLDIPDTEYSAYELAWEIRARNIASPIVFCCSSMNYRSREMLKNSFFIDKPILVAALAKLVDEIALQKDQNYIPTIEIRYLMEVHYLTEQEIVYCESKSHSRYISVHLKDGRVVAEENFLDNFLTELLPLGEFFMANKNVIVNARYVERVGRFRVTLCSGESFQLHGCRKKDVEEYMQAVEALK